MICYRDMTFCGFGEICAEGAGCLRALTKEVEASANLKGLPISSLVREPDCFEAKPLLRQPEALSK